MDALVAVRLADALLDELDRVYVLPPTLTVNVGLYATFRFMLNVNCEEIPGPLTLSVTVVELVTLGIDKLAEPDPLESVVIVVDAPVLSETVYEEFGTALDMFTVIPIVSL
jgi:hypothetical protein